MAFEFETGSALISALITILITALFIHFAARIVIDRSSYLVSIGVAVIGTILATIVWAIFGGLLGMILAIASWALVAALFFRTGWLKGAVIGIVAWLLWLLVSWLIGLIF